MAKIVALHEILLFQVFFFSPSAVVSKWYYENFDNAISKKKRFVIISMNVMMVLTQTLPVYESNHLIVGSASVMAVNYFWLALHHLVQYMSSYLMAVHVVLARSVISADVADRHSKIIYFEDNLTWEVFYTSASVSLPNVQHSNHC